LYRGEDAGGIAANVMAGAVTAGTVITGGSTLMTAGSALKTAGSALMIFGSALIIDGSDLMGVVIEGRLTGGLVFMTRGGDGA